MHMLEAIFQFYNRNGDAIPLLMPLLCFLLFWKQLAKKELLLFFYCLISILFYVSTNFVANFYKNNAPMYHFFTLFEQWYVSYYILSKTAIVFPRKLYLVTNASFTIFWLFNIIFFEPLTHFNSNSISLSYLILMVLSMYYIYTLTTKDEILNFQRSPSFWIVSGLLIAFAINLMVYFMVKYYVLENHFSDGIKLLFFSGIATFLKCLLISIGLLFYRRENPIVISLYEN